MSGDLLPSQLLPLLTVATGPLQGASFRLGTGVCTIGREDETDIVVDDSRVSRRHASLELADGRAILTDLDSTNGTWLNGQRLTGSAALRDGDRIRVGGVEFRYYDPAAAQTEPVSTIRYLPPALPTNPTPTPLPAGPAQPTVHPVAEPAQPMPAGRRPGRILLAAAVTILLVGGVLWVAYG